MYKLKSIILFFFISISIYGQDPHYSQFYSNLLYLNPAFAGYKDCPYLSMAYRNHWPGLENSFSTYSVAYDFHVPSINGGFGFQLMNDNQGSGAINQLTFDGIYSHQIVIKRNFFIRAAIQLTYLQWSVNTSKLVFNDMIDNYRGLVNTSNENLNFENIHTLDISTGVIAYNSKYYFGLALHHLRQPLLEEQISPMKITAHFGMLIDIDTRDQRKVQFTISPNIIYQQQQGFQQINYGAYVMKNNFTAGLWLRQNIMPQPGFDAVTLLLGISVQRIKFGYSYDFTISKLMKYTSGSHEVSLSVQFDCFEKIKKHDIIKCPSF